MHRIAALLFSALAPAFAHAAPPDTGLHFDSPRVVDLSSRQSNFDAKAPAVPVVALAPDDARAILAAPASGEGDPLLPFVRDRFGCDDEACVTRAEAQSIEAEKGAVVRKGTTLTVNPVAGEPARFVDFSIKGSATAEGDSLRHRYLGRVGPSGLLHVDVEFGHDAPGAFLIGPKSGKVAFVHKGSDVTAFSPDARLVVVLNSLNSPAAVTVAALDDDGPAPVLFCSPARDSRVLADFKGWHGAASFDIALKHGHTMLPLRVERTGGAWRIATPEPAQLEAADGFACRQQ